MIEKRYQVPRTEEKALREAVKAADGKQEMAEKRKKGAFKKGNRQGGRPKL